MYLVMLAFSVVLFAGVVVWFARSPASSWFHPLTVYLGFHGLVFTIRPLLAYYYDFGFVYKLYQFTPDLHAKVMALAAADLGLIAFAWMSLKFGSAPIRFPHKGTDTAERATMLRPLLVVMAVLTPLAAYSLYGYWQESSGAETTMVTDLTTGTTIHSGGSGYLQEAQLMLVPLTVLFAWLNRFRLWSLIPLALFVLFRAGTGGRGPIVIALLGLACFYLYDNRRKWPNWGAVTAVLAAVLLFNAIGADRGAAVRELVTGDDATSRISSKNLAPMEGMDLANLEYIEFLTATVPQRTGTYEYFTDQLQLLTEPIPRALWKDKPIGQPIRLFNLFDYGFPIGMTRSLPGEGWTQLGLIGVALWCGLWGGVLGAIYQRVATGGWAVAQVCLYFALWPMLIIFYRDGLLLTLLRQGIFLIGPVVIWLGLAKRLGAHARPAAPPEMHLVQPERARRQARSERLVPRAWRKHAPSEPRL